MRKTKIVATLGPVVHSEEKITALIAAGMDVARFNMSHSTHEEHLERFIALKQARKKANKHVAALLDTKGPEVRLGLFQGGEAYLEEGSTFVLTAEEVLGNESIASVTYKNLAQDVKPGNSILLSDGEIALVVTEVKEDEIYTVVVNGGKISDRKGVNTPGVHRNMEYLSEIDKRDLLFGIGQGFDFVAASFVECVEDMQAVRRFLDENGGKEIKIIAKIESERGVENADEIIAVSDGVMVARGDMGVELPLCEVPILQKRLIQSAHKAGVQVITATQMLESMITNPRPTRAENTDVANAIYDGTSAVMLSGETAAGKYPVESVKTMAEIALRTEEDINYKRRFLREDGYEVRGVPDAISHAACTISYDLNAKAILAMTKSGNTADLVSKFRPAVPIVGCAVEERVLRQMNLFWGVVPIKADEQVDLDVMIDQAILGAKKEDLLGEEDLAVVTAGVPLGKSGLTNLIKVETVK
ncbi:MAG: pyruvate kinase [Christensenellaceae bacterium]|jgi:pyruvate kinase